MLDGVFNEKHVPTIGSQFATIGVEIEQRPVVLDVWDTAGQEVYRSLVVFYTRDARGAFLLFDVTREPSFENLPKWLSFVRDRAPGVSVVLFANKCDLETDRAVSPERIRAFADAEGLPVFEGSAKSGRNMRDAFERMGELMLSDEFAIARTEVAVAAAPRDACC
jgi:small GTP-binding protein